MSNRCSPVPVSTLYGQFTTTQLVTNTVVATSTLPDGEVIASTSYDVESSLGTQASPTSTLYSTRCRSDDSQRQTQTQTQTQTAAQTTTQDGGRVIVQTIIRTATSEGRVVVETQTATPTQQSTPTTLASSQDSQQHNTNAGAIAGGIVGAVALLAILFGLLWFVRKRRRNAMASRNLDEFFADPSAQGWDEKQANGGGGNSTSRTGSILGAAGASSKGGTLRSIKRKSLAVLDLDKEKSGSETNDNHWAALTRIDSAQMDGELVEDEEVQSYGRPQSRQSLNALDRPLSFHSMSIGHGLSSPQPFGLPVPGLSPDHDQLEKDAILLRNGSDRSSKSAHSPGELGALKTRSMDMLPSFLSNASPPISPTSPYSSPPLREMPLHEGVAISSKGYENSRPSIARGSRYSISSNMMMTDMSNDAKKTRSWSASSYNMPERPKSALGLSSHASPPLSSIFAGSAIQQSPPLSPTLMPMASPSHNNAQKSSADLQRGRASINGGTPHYPSVRYSRAMQTLSRHPSQFSPHSPSSPQGYNASSSTQYPPSQYTHLDAHKTEEERAEDRMHAMNSISTMNGLEKYQDERIQTRQRSLSGALLLRVRNGEDSPIYESTTLIPQAGEMTPNSSGERSTLSVRNADSSKQQQR